MPSRSLAVISICLATVAAFSPSLSASPILSSAASPRATQLHLRATTAAQSAAAKKRAQSGTTKSQFSSKRRQRVPVPPPKPDAPTPRETLPKWATIQVTSDFISLCVLSLLTKISIPDLFLEGNSNLLWFLGGPALITFGGVWQRVTAREEIPDFESDFFVKKLGGADAVRALRYYISEALVVRAK